MDPSTRRLPFIVHGESRLHFENGHARSERDRRRRRLRSLARNANRAAQPGRRVGDRASSARAVQFMRDEALARGRERRPRQRAALDRGCMAERAHGARSRLGRGGDRSRLRQPHVSRVHDDVRRRTDEVPGMRALHRRMITRERSLARARIALHPLLVFERLRIDAHPVAVRDQQTDAHLDAVVEHRVLQPGTSALHRR